MQRGLFLDLTLVNTFEWVSVGPDARQRVREDIGPVQVQAQECFQRSMI